MSRYEITQDGVYIVHDYNRAKPFSSFLPGIAGLRGKPVWAYYVNRGQGICTFGTQDKDHAIVEFDSAQLHQQRVALEGFRTFIRVRRGGGAWRFWEPFGGAGQGGERSRMEVRPQSLALSDEDAELGLGVRVEYAGLPNEDFAALLRRVEIRNTGGGEVEVEVLDGLPRIVPFGMDHALLKMLPFVSLGYLQVDGVEERTPFVHLKALSSDSWDNRVLPQGNVFCAAAGVGSERGLLRAIVDPERVFGDVGDLVLPRAFLAAAPYDASLAQSRHCQTCCAFTYHRARIGAGAVEAIDALYGKAERLEDARGIGARLLDAGWLPARLAEATEVVQVVRDRFFVHAGDSRLVNYVKNTYLDNVLRGGLPITIDTGKSRVPYHVYSRKHGDLERDYNMFRLEPSFYAQGNGNFRDVNQNRRHDVWLNPDVGDVNLRYFFNLIQLDGFNPLICHGSRFRVSVPEAVAPALAKLAGEVQEAVLGCIGKPFTPGALLELLRARGVGRGQWDGVLHAALDAAERLEDAEFGHGYWTDHWMYNFDHLETFGAIFPERVREVLVERCDYTYFDTDQRVLPRHRRFVRFDDGRVLQVDCVERDEEKARMIGGRGEDGHRVRAGRGRGAVYRCSLLQKIMCLLINKIASVSPSGLGVEMEGGRPGWHDSINGIPGAFGATISEIFHLRRAIVMVREMLRSAGLPGEGQALPVELAELHDAVMANLGRRLAAGEEDAGADHAYWDGNATAKEAYRERIRFGVDGAERRLSAEELGRFLEAAASLCERSLRRSTPADGIPRTYVRHEALRMEAVVEGGVAQRHGVGGELVRVQAFGAHFLPAFLEAPTHALRTGTVQGAEAMGLYRSIRSSPLFDGSLGMYLAGDSVQAEGPQVGRIWAWAPGWFENENVFLHLEHKFMLGLLYAGLYEEFFQDFRNCLICWQDPERYGRNPLENASFIMSSRHPRPHYRGRGFQPRSSGTTAEVMEMLLFMAFGPRPFQVEGGELVLEFKPVLPGWIFEAEPARRERREADGRVREEVFPGNAFAMLFLGRAMVVFVNPTGRATYGRDAAGIVRMVLQMRDGRRETVEGARVGSRLARMVRDGAVERIEVMLG